MSFDTRAGTRGLPMEGSKLNLWIDQQMAKRSVRKVLALLGFDVLVLTTVGHRAGVRHPADAPTWTSRTSGLRSRTAVALGHLAG